MGMWLRSTATSLAVSTVLFVMAEVANLIFNSRIQNGLPLLFILPVVILSYSFGSIAAVLSSLFAVVLVDASNFASAGSYTFLGTVLFGMTLVSIGLGISNVTGARKTITATDLEWFEMSNDMLVEASLDGYFTRLSDRWEEVLGWTKEELMSRPFKEFIYPDDVDATSMVADPLDTMPGEVVNFENRYVTKDGSYRWLLWCARSDNQRKYAVARDITDRKLLEQEREDLIKKVEAIARTDPLTGLPNRRSWDEELRKELARSKRSGRSLALAIIDLDNFKDYNDSNGHGAGDELLIKAASVWSSVLREADFMARYGGEEFAVLIYDSLETDVVAIIDRLRQVTPNQQTCSAGVAFWNFELGPDEFTAKADLALYEAKRAGRNLTRVANPDLN